MKDVDSPHSKAYSSIDEAAQKLFRENESAEYFEIISAVKKLGIEGVYDSTEPGQSEKLSADFRMALSYAKSWIEKLALEHAVLGKPSADAVFKEDPLTEMAARFKWKGMYKSSKYTEEEQKAYSEFAEKWNAEKARKFSELSEKYRQEICKPKKSGIPGYIAKAASAIGAAALLAFAAYEYYLKPDIKKEVEKTKTEIREEMKSAIPKIPNLDEMVEKFRPEIREELERYNTQSAENIEDAIVKTLSKYGKGSPFFEALFPELKKKLQEDIAKEQEKKEK